MKDVEKDFSTISIKKEIEKQHQKKESQSNTENSSLREKFSEYQLQDAWKVVCGEYVQRPDFYSTLAKYPPELTDETTVLFYVDNKTQQEQFRNHRADILLKLRTVLKNFAVTINVEIKEAEGSDHVYTATEKFEYLKKKNPLLEKLKKDLNLEIRI